MAAASTNTRAHTRPVRLLPKARPPLATPLALIQDAGDVGSECRGIITEYDSDAAVPVRLASPPRRPCQ